MSTKPEDFIVRFVTEDDLVWWKRCGEEFHARYCLIEYDENYIPAYTVDIFKDGLEYLLVRFSPGACENVRGFHVIGLDGPTYHRRKLAAL